MLKMMLKTEKKMSVISNEKIDEQNETLNRSTEVVEKVSEALNAQCFEKMVECVPNLLKQSKFF